MKKIFTLMTLALLASAQADEKVASKWNGVEIKVDGADSEWIDSINYLEKEKLGFGIKNDSSYLYFCFKFDTETLRQARTAGFTAWIDASGKNKMIFGVRFPIGMQNFDGELPEPLPPSDDPEERQKRFEPMLQEIEVLGADKDDRNRFSINSSFGINAAGAKSPSELFVCELKIPLKTSAGKPYAIGANAGQTVSVGFEMGEIDRGKMRERMMARGGGFGGGRPPGGGVPPEGGRPGGPPGGMREGRPKMSGPFKVWVQVGLAAGETVKP